MAKETAPPSLARDRASKLYREIKKRTKALGFMDQMKIANVDSFDDLPPNVQQVFVDALATLNAEG